MERDYPERCPGCGGPISTHSFVRDNAEQLWRYECGVRDEHGDSPECGFASEMFRGEGPAPIGETPEGVRALIERGRRHPEELGAGFLADLGLDPQEFGLDEPEEPRGKLWRRLRAAHRELMGPSMMAMLTQLWIVDHVKSSGKSDGADATLVRPSDWNADHKFDVPDFVAGSQTLTNVGAAYDTVRIINGFCEMIMDGVDTAVFTLLVTKVGTGTQDWQLWNDTDGTQLTVVSDAGAAARRFLTVTATSLALTGTKRFRVRAKSGTAADDPVLEGAHVIWRKTA